jgi:hypothetical protein
VSRRRPTELSVHAGQVEGIAVRRLRLPPTTPDQARRPGATITPMCTVVVRWAEGAPTQILALRDELTGREFDDPAAWWPEHPDVVGGRDRTAGGTWAATHVATGVTALVLNRPQKRDADEGAPSRGVLPLLGAVHEDGWLGHVRLDGMASFLLVLTAPDRLVTWDFDGAALTRAEHPEGTWMVTSGGPEDRKADRFLPAFTDAEFPDGWRGLVEKDPPQDDPGALVVRHEHEGLVYATVFGELLEAAPGRLRLEHSRRPWSGEPWPALHLG